MLEQHLAIALGITLLCATGLARSAWLLDNTRKGRQLTEWFGPRTGLLVLRGVLVLFLVLGIGIGTGWIQPLRW